MQARQPYIIYSLWKVKFIVKLGKNTNVFILLLLKKQCCNRIKSNDNLIKFLRLGQSQYSTTWIESFIKRIWILSIIQTSKWRRLQYCQAIWKEKNQLVISGNTSCILTTLSIIKLPMCAVLRRCVPQQGSTDARDAFASSCWSASSSTAEMTCTVLGYTSPGTSVMLPCRSSSWKLMVRRRIGCPLATQLWWDKWQGRLQMYGWSYLEWFGTAAQRENMKLTWISAINWQTTIYCCHSKLFWFWKDYLPSVQKNRHCYTKFLTLKLEYSQQCPYIIRITVIKWQPVSKTQEPMLEQIVGHDDRARTHLCLTPELIGKKSVMPPSHFTALSVSE